MLITKKGEIRKGEKRNPKKKDKGEVQKFLDFFKQKKRMESPRNEKRKLQKWLYQILMYRHFPSLDY